MVCNAGVPEITGGKSSGMMILAAVVGIGNSLQGLGNRVSACVETASEAQDAV